MSGDEGEARVIRDPDELLRTLAAQTWDVRSLDVAGFRDWLARHLERWRHDPAFALRCRIRDLRQAHPELLWLETRYRRAAVADLHTPHARRLHQLERAIHGARKAIAGLADALGTTPAERQAALAAKQATFEERLRTLLAEQAALVASSPERQLLLQTEAELQRMCSAVGLAALEAELETALLARGRRSGRAGTSFEAVALALTESHIIPQLRAAHRNNASNLRVLRGVTLGAARTEIDLLVVDVSAGPARPVEVLALVEAKRNINDLAHGFLQRQENLAWLTGDATAYDPAQYRTRQFPTGHFDRPAEHRQDGGVYRLGRDSFSRFQRGPGSGYFLDRLYLVSRVGPLWGLSAGALARVSARIAGDVYWDPSDDAYLAGLLAWCRSLAGPLESPDLVRLYADSPAWAQQILVERGL